MMCPYFPMLILFGHYDLHIKISLEFIKVLASRLQQYAYLWVLGISFLVYNFYYIMLVSLPHPTLHKLTFGGGRRLISTFMKLMKFIEQLQDLIN